jgi:hypothetical protein
MPSRHPTSVLLSLLLLAVAGPALAQVSAPTERAAPRTLTRAERDGVLAEVSAALRESYVFPEKVGAIVERLEQSRKAGRYELDDAAILAERITQDLQAASGDHHLYMNYAPTRAAPMAPRMRMRVPGDGEARRPAPGDGEARRQAPGGDEARRQALRDHHGLAELKLLPGNLRYLRITGFQWVPEETGPAYDAALRFLKEGDAVIIDLRGNGGGSHEAVRYLVSHFMDGGVLEMTFLEAGMPPEQSRTLEDVPAGRLTGKPLYVLIDGNSASAAEAFAYDVAHFKLGQLVGAKTAGGANNNRFVPIRPGFLLSVSVGRPVHPVTHSNWEGVGVAPTVEAPPARALEIAQSLALTQLARTAGVTPEALADYEWARIAIEAALHPVTLPAAKLKPLAGRYGEVEVTLREGALWMARKGRPDRRLSPLTADGLFAVEGSDLLRVRFTAKTLETLWRGDPATRVYPRG